MMSDKLVYLAWDEEARDRPQLRSALLERCAPALGRAGATRLQMNIADQYAQVKSPAPKLLREQTMSAQVNVWTDANEDPAPLEEVLRGAGFRIAGYRVDEQIYTEYGGNRHGAPRSWPDGERSPGVLAVTLMERPKRLAYGEWIRRWHDRQSPMSEAMQPRARYVRNVVREPLTPDAPPFEGIVEEAWPSFEHVTNKYLFYGADNAFELAKHMGIMLHSVVSFLDLWRIRTVMTSEYFLATGFESERPTPTS
jgi:hypothetical protein